MKQLPKMISHFQAKLPKSDCRPTTHRVRLHAYSYAVQNKCHINKVKRNQKIKELIKMKRKENPPQKEQNQSGHSG